MVTLLPVTDEFGVAKDGFDFFDGGIGRRPVTAPNVSASSEDDVCVRLFEERIPSPLNHIAIYSERTREERKEKTREKLA